MRVAEQKLAYIEGSPSGWPDGWAFGPKKPIPPGFRVDGEGIVIAASAVSSVAPVVEAYALDSYGEDTDALDGQVMMFRCEDEAGSRVRCRLAASCLPFSEQLLLKVNEYEPGRWGVMRHFEIDWSRTKSNNVKMIIGVFGCDELEERVEILR